MKLLAAAILVAALLIPMNQFASQEELRNLERQLAALREELARRPQLEHPLSPTERALVGAVALDVLRPAAMDLAWDGFVRYFTFFESLDGFTVSNAAFTGNDVELSIPNTLGGEASLAKSVSYQPFLSFRARSYFRTTVIATTGTLSNMRAKIVVGAATADGAGDYTTNNKGYGFKIDGTSLKGIVGNGTSESSVTLATLSENTAYSLTAKFFPSSKVVFYVNGVEIAVLDSNLPTSGATSESSFFAITGTNANTTASKKLKVSFFDYIQDRVAPQ